MQGSERKVRCLLLSLDDLNTSEDILLPSLFDLVYDKDRKKGKGAS